LILGYPAPYSGASQVLIYYGGPHMDSIPDVYLSDYTIPGYHTQYGLTVTGIGDFNNDGINDFAVSMIDGQAYGQVLIYSGTGKYTGVTEEPRTDLPDKFTVSRNYPNPFNPSTVVEFSLPRRSHVRVEVLNVIGQVVEILAEREMASGSYRATWNGVDAHGHAMPTGVYFMRVTADGDSQTRKMMLVK
jgi:hypothetical protein